MREHNIHILNVAGPRESNYPSICMKTEKVLAELFAVPEPVTKLEQGPLARPRGPRTTADASLSTPQATISDRISDETGPRRAVECRTRAARASPAKFWDASVPKKG